MPRPTVRIPVGKDSYAIVDEADSWVSSYSWSSDGQGYAKTKLGQKTITMHRLLFPDCPKGLVRDHINRDKSDNKHTNIRFITPQQNLRNTKVYSTNTSGCTGVTFHKARKKFRATIKVDKKLIQLGEFKDFLEAVACRKQAEVKYQWGDLING